MCDHLRVGEYLWTEHIRDDRPLERLLKDKARKVRENAAWVRSTGDTVEEIVDRVSQDWLQFAQPIERSGDPEPDGEPYREVRHDRNVSATYQYWRWVYRVPVNGDIELLERWPEQLEREPLGEHLFEPPTGPWMRSGDGFVSIYADVPVDQDPDGVKPPLLQISDAAAYVAEAIAVTNAQVAEYNLELRNELLTSVQARLDRLTSIAEGDAEVIDLIIEQFGPLTLEATEGAPIIDVVVLGEEPREPVAVDLNFALNDGSFDSVLKVVDKWRTGVERYRVAFAKLEEEDISGLLVTTLNTVFESAHREVFQAEGKTDIFVQADTGNYEKAAHIAEAKIWRGQGEVAGDIGQLLGYGTARTESQLLLYYVRQKNLPLIVERCKEAVFKVSADTLKELNQYDFETQVGHPVLGTSVSLMVMFVHVWQENAADPDESQTLADA